MDATLKFSKEEIFVSGIFSWCDMIFNFLSLLLQHMGSVFLKIASFFADFKIILSLL